MEIVASGEFGSGGVLDDQASNFIEVFLMVTIVIGNQSVNLIIRLAYIGCAVRFIIKVM